MGFEGKPVVTRFAPSPTGYLHIGGARTALFNWLYAKHTCGKMLLRIEDTDQERHNESAVKAILDGLEWLGIAHDGEVIRQGERMARHAEVAYDLVSKGRAYKCYCSKEKLDELREQATKEKKPFRYPGICRDLPADYTPPEGSPPPTIRLKVGREGSISWDDKVQGTITVDLKEIDDLIILRGNGTPIYILAVVVDDHDMEVTNVIRGSDHITNTIAIYQAAEWDIPSFAHIPLIFGGDGKKLSKRHGATGLEEYEKLGYLPEAMRNYLARLGWSHGDDEIFSTEQAIEWFDMTSCSKSPACFDFAKLDNLNGHYIRECDPQRLLSLFFKLYPELEAHKGQITQAVDMLKPRAKTLVQFRDAANFIFAQRPLPMDKKAEKIIADPTTKDILGGLSAAILAYSGEWDEKSIEDMLNQYAEKGGLKMGKVAQPLRAALTGTTASPGIYEVLWILGKKEVLDRLQDVLSR